VVTRAGSSDPGPGHRPAADGAGGAFSLSHPAHPGGPVRSRTESATFGRADTRETTGVRVSGATRVPARGMSLRGLDSVVRLAECRLHDYRPPDQALDRAVEEAADRRNAFRRHRPIDAFHAGSPPPRRGMPTPSWSSAGPEAVLLAVRMEFRHSPATVRAAKRTACGPR